MISTRWLGLVALLSAFQIPAAAQGPAPTAPASLVEIDTNRYGSDYERFELSAAEGSRACFARCKADAGCAAWTYVKPGVQGPQPVCYLKNPAPAPTKDPCCVSGAIARAADPSSSFEADVNLYGSDYADFDLAVGNPQQCLERCKGDPRCAAWTFVKPSAQGSPARCYLKNPVPERSRNDCCVSGVMTKP